MAAEVLFRRNVVREALRAGRRPIYRLVVERGAKRAELADILAEAERRGVAVVEDDKARMNVATEGVNHQGVLLEVGPYPYVALDEIAAAARARGEAPFVLALDLIHDPRNVGALLRSAEAAGVHGVIVQDKRAGDITPTVVTTSAGAAEHLHVARVVNLVRALQDLKAADVWIAGLALTPEAEDYTQANLRGGLALVIGNEGAGLRRLVRETCDMLLKIPMQGHVESLNAAVAGSVVLFHVAAGRRGAAG
jgi:23S rRNA (guanosine2251-2'-O)-methyltransferase